MQIKTGPNIRHINGQNLIRYFHLDLYKPQEMDVHFSHMHTSSLVAAEQSYNELMIYTNRNDNINQLRIIQYNFSSTNISLYLATNHPLFIIIIIASCVLN